MVHIFHSRCKFPRRKANISVIHHYIKYLKQPCSKLLFIGNIGEF